MAHHAKLKGPFQFRLRTLFVTLTAAAFCFAFPLFTFCVAGMIVLILNLVVGVVGIMVEYSRKRRFGVSISRFLMAATLITLFALLVYRLTL